MRRRDFVRASALSGLVAGTFGGADPLAALTRSSPRRLANGQVRLSSNENPLGISPAAKDAVIEAITVANRYPRSQRDELVAHLAQGFDVETSQIVMGVGSSEILQMAAQALAVGVMGLGEFRLKP